MKAGWTIGKKLVVSFLGVAAVTLVLGGVGFYGVSTGAATIKTVGGVRLPSVDSLLNIKEASSGIKMAMRTMLAAQLDAETTKQQYESIAKDRAQYEAAWKVYEALPQTDEDAALWKKFVPAWQEWRKENNEFMQLRKEFEKKGIANATQLQEDVARFTADHHRLISQLLTALHAKSTFDGGEDPTKCAFGRWKATFKTDNAVIQSAMADATEPHDRFHANVAKIKQMVRDGKTKEAIDLYTAEIAPLTTKLTDQFARIDKEAQEAHALFAKVYQQAMTKCLTAGDAANALLDQIVEVNRKAAAEDARKAEQQAGILKAVSVVAMAAGVLIAVALGLTMAHSINKVLTRIATALGERAEHMNDASAQVSMASQQLAEGASEQASSLEETSSALEQMAGMARQNADNSKQANELTVQTKAIMDEATSAMKEATDAMQQISEASEKISKIIKVIEEIAFQTNLLALNAAVEAARAGEHGKGFAVVADEVRSLAQRAAQAARETGDLIEQTVTRVSRGVELNQTTSASFTKVGESSAQVAHLIAQITQASAEQAQGVEQVNTAVSQMDKVTQQTAANAEESAGAAQELTAHAQAVKTMVDELVSLVGGRRSAEKGTAAKASAKASADALVTASAKAVRAATSTPTPHLTLSTDRATKDDGTKTAKTAKKAKTTPKTPRSPTQSSRSSGEELVVSAADAIPLDGDLKDF